MISYKLLELAYQKRYKLVNISYKLVRKWRLGNGCFLVVWSYMLQSQKCDLPKRHLLEWHWLQVFRFWRVHAVNVVINLIRNFCYILFVVFKVHSSIINKMYCRERYKLNEIINSKGIRKKRSNCIERKIFY